MTPAWSHLATDKSDYWKSLSGIHTFAFICTYLEIILKALIVAYLVYDYKQKNPQELSKYYINF